MNESQVIGKIVGILFMSRNYAHMSHLSTPSYAKHIALAELYEDIVEIADKLAEASQGKFGKIDVPVIEMKGDVKDPVNGIQSHVVMIENLHKKCTIPWIDNIIQEIEAMYYTTLYKLRELD